MDDEGNLLLKRVELDMLRRPRLALVNELSEWSRRWMQEYYGLVSSVDPDSPADADQAEDMAGQKEKHDAIMELVPFSDVTGLAALLHDAQSIGMPVLRAGKRPQVDPTPPPPQDQGAPPEEK